MMAVSPYRLQIFIPDEEMREAIKDVAHREKTSVQKLVVRLLLDKIHEYPEYQHIEAVTGRNE